MADDVVGSDCCLAAAIRGVDDKGGHCVTGCMAAQPANQLNTLGDGRAKVRRSGDWIALIQVVGFDANTQQTMHQLFHGHRIIVNTL
jgi:hypothetical protein